MITVFCGFYNDMHEALLEQFMKSTLAFPGISMVVIRYIYKVANDCSSQMFMILQNRTMVWVVRNL